MLRDSTRNDASSDDLSLDVAQTGAICYGNDKKRRLEVLLVGSRRNGRRGAPKGHIESREPSNLVASREAFEEAGILSVVAEVPFGTFSYQKDTSRNRYTVTVHPLEVSRVADKFPEKNIRRVRGAGLRSQSGMASSTA